MKKLLPYGVIVTLLLLVSVGCESIVQEQTANNSKLEQAPDVLNKKPGANPNAVFSLDFSDPANVADNSTANAGWVKDRQAPEMFEAVTFDGDERLRINIDESGPTSGFYGYQGKKYQDAGGSYWKAESNTRFSYRFYIDPAWEDDGGKEQQTGVWPVLGNASGSISAYPILEYQDSDANENGEAGFRAYVYLSDEDGNFAGAEWVTIGLPKKLKIDPETGGWVTVEAQLHQNSGGSALKWRINNKLVFDERGYNVFAPSTQYLEFIFNSANFGQDQNYYYDDIMLTEAGHAGKN